MDGGGGGEDEDGNTAEKAQPKDSTENPSSQLGTLDHKDGDTSNSDNCRTLNLTEKPSQSHQQEDVGRESDDDAIETNNLVIDETPSQSHQHVGDDGDNATRTNNPSTLNPAENSSQQYDHLGANIDNTSKTTSKIEHPKTHYISEIPTQSHQQLVSHQQLESHLNAYVATPARDALKALIKIKIQEKSKQQSKEEVKTAASTADNSDQALLLQGASNASDDAYQGQELQENESMEWSHDEDGGSRSCEDSTSPGKDKKVLKKEKHRYAAKRYRHKEIWLRDKLQKDEKELIEANTKLGGRAKALEAIKAECLAELKNLDKNQLCKGLTALAQSVPPGYEDAVVSIKMVLYREIGGQMKELGHLVNPTGDQVVPGQGVSVEGLATRIGVHPQDLVLVPPGAASSYTTGDEPCEKIIITCRPVNDGTTPQSASNKPVIDTIPGIIYAGEGTIMVASMKPSPGERVIDASRKDLPQASVSPLNIGNQVPPLFVGNQHNVLPLHAGNHSSAPPLHHGTSTAPLPIAGLHTEIQVPVAAPLPVRTEYVTVVPSMNQTSVPPLHAGTHNSTGPLPAGSYGTTPVLHVGNQQTEAPLPVRTEYVMTPSVTQAPKKTSPFSNHTQRERSMPVLEQSAPIDLSKATGLKETKKYEKVDNLSDDIQVQEVSQSSSSINTTDDLLSSAAMALIDLSNAHALIDLSKTGAMRRLDLAPVQRGSEFAPINTSQALVPEASNTGSMMIQQDYGHPQVYTQQSSISQTDPAQVGLPYSRTDPVISSPPPKQTSPLDLSKSKSQTDSQDPNVQEISTQTTRETSTPVIVFVQSLSSGMGELPRIDLNQTKPVLPATGNHSEPSIQSSNQVYNQATQQTQYHSIHDPEQERQHFAQLMTQSVDTNSSSSSSSDEEPSTSGHSSEQPHQLGSPVKLLHKSLLSAQRGPVQPLIGITRKERQRYASKKNRQKNQLIKKALLKDEEHLKKANAKLHDIIQDLESIKGHCLAELATTNQYLTGQLRSHSATNQDTQLKPYWESVRLSMSLLVPHPLSSKYPPMCISANFPFKKLRSDNQMWSKPMDPKYLNSVLMNVKLDRLEWNGTLLSPGTVRERKEEKQVKDSGEKMKVAEESPKLVVLVKPDEKMEVLVKPDEKMEVLVKPDEKMEVLLKPDEKMEVVEKPAVPSFSDAKWLLQLQALHPRQVSPSVEPHGSGEKMEVVEKL